MTKNTERYTKQSDLAKAMKLDSSQEANILKIFESCGIGEITSVSVFQEGAEHTAYHLEDKETGLIKALIIPLLYGLTTQIKRLNQFIFTTKIFI